MSHRLGTFALALLTVVLLAGCDGGPQLASVSGVVTVNGDPYPNALVSFQPVSEGADKPPGKGSMGQTDEKGRFTLQYDGKKSGAVVGKHIVRISTVPGKGSKEPVDTSLGSPDSGDLPKGVTGLEFDPIPVEWNEKSTRVFEVTAGGTDQANFVIETKKKK
jgi:hypothetical protein